MELLLGLSASTVIIQRAMNQSLFVISGEQKKASGHFIALKDQVIPTLIKLISGDVALSASLHSWKKAYDLGSKLCFVSLMEQVIKDPQNMKLVFDKVLMGDDEFLFGEFKT